MKNILKLSLIVLLAIFTINTSFAGGGSINYIDYSYNGSLKDSALGNKVKLKGYINPSSLQYGDDGLNGVNIKYLESYLSSYGIYNISEGMSFGLFYSENEVESVKIDRDDGSSYYSRYFDSDLNKGLMLFASKDFIESLNYNDPTYYDLGKTKLYNNGDTINRNIFENGVFKNTYGDNIKGGTDIKGNIISSAGGDLNIPNGNVIIEGEFKNISIDEDFICENFYKNYNGEYYSSGEKGRCINLVNNVKKDYYKGKIDSDTFKNLFINIWDSNIIEKGIIKTKVFVIDKIIVNGVTYGDKAHIYNLSLNTKKSLNKTLDVLNKLPDNKKEDLKYKIDSLINTQKYGTKNYVLLNYLKSGIENYYPENKKKEAKIILDELKQKYKTIDELVDLINKLIGE